MLDGFLRPGYDYLLERKLPGVPREAKHHPIGADLDRFLAGAADTGRGWLWSRAARVRTKSARPTVASVACITESGPEPQNVTIYSLTGRTSRWCSSRRRCRKAGDCRRSTLIVYFP